MQFSFPRETLPLTDPQEPRGVPHRPPRARSSGRKARGRTSFWNPPRAQDPIGRRPPSEAIPSLPASKHGPPTETPRLTRHGPRGGPRAQTRASGGGAPLAPVAGVWPHPSTPKPNAPSPRSVPKSFTAEYTTHDTCRSASPHHPLAKTRETSAFVTRDFLQHGVPERARDGVQGLLLAAPRALLGEHASTSVLTRERPLTFASFTMMAAYDGRVCGASGADEPNGTQRRRWRPLVLKIRSAYVALPARARD